MMEKIIYAIRILPTWILLTLHNTWGIFNVFFIVWVRPMKGGMATLHHPFATGIDPQDEKYIWHKNLLFQSERKREFAQTDEEILTAVGLHMASMFTKSCEQEGHALGIPDRMPPAINYIHGGVHYNGGFLIFDDTKDAIAHFSNPDFQRSFWKFILQEKREPVTILREKNYDRMEYLEFVCFMRSIFPYFSNTNGNKKRIGWGNPAPYPSVNTITGHWKTDTYKFYSKEKAAQAARPAIQKQYFTKKIYSPVRTQVRWPEKFLARFTNDRVLARGLKGNVFFVDNRKLLQGYKFDGANLPTIIERLPERINDAIQRRFKKAVLP